MNDLIDLIAINRRYELEDWWDGFLAACKARSERRNRFSARSRKGAETRRSNARERLRAPAAFGVTALSPCGSSPAVSPASPLQSTGADDWDQCPNCGFILVACDCDAPHFNLEHDHAA